MTDTKKGNLSARILIIALAVALAVMLGASLKARFQNPHLTVAARQQQGMGGGEAGEDAQTVGKLMREVAENPQDLGALVHLIEHLVTAQNWDAAETFAQRAITLDAANSKPLYLLGVIMHNQGRNKEAAEALEKVLAIKDDEAIYAGYELTRMEGIIPAIESAHAVAALKKMKFKKDDVVVLTVSGRGDKDVETYLAHKEMAGEYGNF